MGGYIAGIKRRSPTTYDSRTVGGGNTGPTGPSGGTGPTGPTGTSPTPAFVFDTVPGQTNIQANRVAHNSAVSSSGTGIFNAGSDTSGTQPGATANYSSVLGGDQNSATGIYSSARGLGTQAQGEASSSEGMSTSIGTTGIAVFTGDHVEGYNCIANSSSGLPGFGAHAEGDETTALGDGAHSEGHNTSASGPGAHAEGYGTSVSGGGGNHAEGINTTATALGAHAEGEDTHAMGVDCHTEGYAGYSYSFQGHSEGQSCVAVGLNDHAEGSGCTASSGGLGFTAAHAEGDGTLASNTGAHSEGKSTTAAGVASHASGNLSYAQRDTQEAFASGELGVETNGGDAQQSRLVLRGLNNGPSAPLLYYTGQQFTLGSTSFAGKAAYLIMVECVAQSAADFATFTMQIACAWLSGAIVFSVSPTLSVAATNAGSTAGAVSGGWTLTASDGGSGKLLFDFSQTISTAAVNVACVLRFTEVSHP